MKVVKRYSAHNSVKSRNLTSTTLDMTIEVRTSEEKRLIREVMKVQSVLNASLLAHDGEVTF